MNILIVGLGSIGRKHVESIKILHPDVSIFALRSNVGADKYPGVINIYSYNDLNIKDVNFAIIANPTSEHKKTIAVLKEYNIPLFIEKPIHTSLDIKGLVDTINENGVLTYVACNLRFLDCIKFVKKHVKEHQNGILNEVNVYCGSYLPDWRPNADFKKTYSAIAELGGGVHIDLIHELDYLYWIFGLPNKTKKTFRSQSSLSITSFDYANYILEYDDFCTNVVLNYYRRDSKRNLELVFENETWNVDLLKNEITCNSEKIFSSKQLISDTYKIQMEYFIQCLSDKSESMNTISDAYNVLKICLK